MLKVIAYVILGSLLAPFYWLCDRLSGHDDLNP